MNLREGKIGRAESVSAAWMAMMISGIFSVNTTATYAYGNASYITSLLSAGLSLIFMMLAAAIMQRKQSVDLYCFMEKSTGKLFSRILAVVIVVGLVCAAVFPSLRLFIIMRRYIYAEAKLASIALYFLPCILFPACMGLETIGRTMRVFIGLIVLSFLVAMLISSNSFEVYRLYPIIGNGMKAIAPLSATGMSRFLPGCIALLIVGQGVQGVKNAIVSGRTAILFSALIVALIQFCLGMAFSYSDLSLMHSPMYRLLMSVEGGSPYARADKLLLFLWTLSGMLTSSFYVYAAALLYARALGMRDVRPGAVCFSVLVTAFILLGQMNLPAFEGAATFLWKNLWLILMLPVLISCVIALFQRKAAVG